MPVDRRGAQTPLCHDAELVQPSAVAVTLPIASPFVGLIVRRRINPKEVSNSHKVKIRRNGHGQEESLVPRTEDRLHLRIFEAGGGVSAPTRGEQPRRQSLHIL